MPLITDDIFQARTAYNALELRAQVAEQSAATLKANLDYITSIQPDIAKNVTLQGQYTATAAGQIGSLQAQQVQQVSKVVPDVAVADFIRSLGLAIAMGESSMPDRTISSVSVTMQSYVTAPDPNTPGSLFGLRLYQPEFGTPTALATMSFDLNKVTFSPGAPAPRSLYLVLQDKQNAYAKAFWTKFTTGNPPTQPAQQIVVEVGKVFAAIGTWTFPYLLVEATTIAGFETALAGLLSGSVSATQQAAYTAAAQSLSSLTQSLAARSDYAAGDLFALSAALDATTKTANTLLP